jgi:hypothetical protein
METTDFNSTLKKLTEQVSNFATVTSKHKETTMFNTNNFLHKFNFNSPVVFYGAIFSGILVILFLWKPKFITEEVSVDGNLPEQKINYQKMILSSMVLTALIAVIIFIKSYRSDIKKDTITHS